MSERIFRETLKNDGWKLKDSFCGVYLFDSKDKKFQIIYNVLDTVVKVLTGKLMNEEVWSGSLEKFVTDYRGFVNGAVSFN